MKIDKRLPVNVLSSLKDLLKSVKDVKSGHFDVIRSDKYLLQLVDVDTESGFYFNIERYDEQHGLLIQHKPQSQLKVAEYRAFVAIGDVKIRFNVWHSCLEAYAKLEEDDKDPFLKKLEDEFLEGFNLDEESKNEPLSLKHILLLEENLSKIENEISEYINESNSVEIAEIIEDAQNLRSNLGKQSKEWIAKKLSTILAKITKEGPDILKGIFKEAGKQIMTQGIKFLIEHGSELIK